MENENKPAKGIITRFLDKDYVIAHTHILSKKNKEIKDMDKFIFLIILRFYNRKDKVSFPSEFTISTIMSNMDGVEVKQPNISKSISNLKKFGYIRVKKTSYYSNSVKSFVTANRYEVLKGLGSIDNFDKIPTALILNTDLHWRDRLFVVQIYPFILPDIDEVRLSMSRLSECLGMSRPTLHSKLKDFTSRGLIEESKSGLGWEIRLWALIRIPSGFVLDLIEKYEDEKRKNRLNNI